MSPVAPAPCYQILSESVTVISACHANVYKCTAHSSGPSFSVLARGPAVTKACPGAPVRRNVGRGETMRRRAPRPCSRSRPHCAPPRLHLPNGRRPFLPLEPRLRADADDGVSARHAPVLHRAERHFTDTVLLCAVTHAFRPEGQWQTSHGVWFRPRGLHRAAQTPRSVCPRPGGRRSQLQVLRRWVPLPSRLCGRHAELRGLGGELIP